MILQKKNLLVITARKSFCIHVTITDKLQQNPVSCITTCCDLECVKTSKQVEILMEK